jgi:hypothetical protein
MAQLTFSPDPVNLLAGAGTAAQQASRPRMYADLENGGWTDTPTNAATGATAGTPGSFTPSGARIPTDTSELMNWGVTANPATAWGGGAYVVLGDSSHTWWSGTAWAAGNAPALGREGAPDARTSRNPTSQPTSQPTIKER